MTKRLSIASAVLTVLSALLALMLVATPAFAGGRGHSNKGQEKSADARDDRDAGDRDGDADSDSSTSYTEKDDGDADDETDPNVDDDDNAHPSGKDRSVENGGSGNQGKSESNPDDSKGPMRYEGELGDDKPAGPGGTDLSDQDGNNGCGNDDDFDDDNNGWCGKPQEETTPTVVAPELPELPEVPEVPEIPEAPEVPESVLGDIITKGDVATDTEVQADDVEAAATRPATKGAALPFTGANLALILVAALGLLGVGVGLLRTSRS